MSDQPDVRALAAERERPTPGPPVEDLLTELIAALHKASTTPPDERAS